MAAGERMSYPHPGGVLTFEKADARAKLPVRGYRGDAGFDLFALAPTVLGAPMHMTAREHLAHRMTGNVRADEVPRMAEEAQMRQQLPRHWARVETGIRCLFPRGWYGMIQERSSQGVRGVVTVGNVIDEGYTAPVSVILMNLGDSPVTVQAGEKIAQLLLLPRFVDALDHTRPERGAKGFGSSGR